MVAEITTQRDLMERTAQKLQDQLGDHLTETKIQASSIGQLRMALSEKSEACDALRRDLEQMLQQSLVPSRTGCMGA